MTLAQKLAGRASVLAYLDATYQQAETELGADGLTDDQWRAAAHRLALARANELKAKMGNGWEPFLADARANGF